MSVILPMQNYEEKLLILKHIIEEKVFVKNDTQRMTDENSNDLAWLMDFRKIILQGDVLSVISELFLEKLYKNKIETFQVGGLESAAIPLIAGMVMKAHESGKNINGFFIRKSRKKTGLLNMTEGEVNKEEVILVDDLLNSGNSIMKQVAILETLGKKVIGVCAILQFRNNKEYNHLSSKGIKVYSLFNLNDFSLSLGLKNIELLPDKNIAITPLVTRWIFTSPGATYEYVIPKSSPLLYDNKLYFGSDNGTFWCLDSKDGSVIWQRKIVHGPKNKKIFSSPAVSKGIVYFGGYDGNFYALDAMTGKPQWVAFEADWIGSSPCVAADLGLVFVGIEFGFWKQKGGVIAYHLETGEVAWKKSSSDYTHGSPSYSSKNNVVVCGSNDGIIYGFSAKKGDIVWNHNTGGEVKAGCAFSPNEKYVAVGSFNKQYVILETKTGKVISKVETLEGNYSTPAWFNDDIVICASLDKHVYAYSISLKKVLWKYCTDARIFASPYIINNYVYIGNNGGFLFVLNILTGECISKHYVLERITNSVVADSQEEVLYIPTQANQILKVEIPKVT